MALRLIPNWRAAPRMFVVQALTVASALQLAWVNVPDDLKASVPPKLLPYVTLAILVLGFLGRLVKQEKVSGGAQ